MDIVATDFCELLYNLWSAHVRALNPDYDINNQHLLITDAACKTKEHDTKILQSEHFPHQSDSSFSSEGDIQTEKTHESVAPLRQQVWSTGDDEQQRASTPVQASSHLLGDESNLADNIIGDFCKRLISVNGVEAPPETTEEDINNKLAGVKKAEGDQEETTTILLKTPFSAHRLARVRCGLTSPEKPVFPGQGVIPTSLLEDLEEDSNDFSLHSDLPPAYHGSIAEIVRVRGKKEKLKIHSQLPPAPIFRTLALQLYAAVVEPVQEMGIRNYLSLRADGVCGPVLEEELIVGCFLKGGVGREKDRLRELLNGEEEGVDQEKLEEDVVF